MKYFKWFFLLLKAAILRKATYTVSFTHEEDDRWYVDFPGWPLKHSQLQMVAGADDLLDLLNDGSDHVHLKVSTNSSKPFPDMPSSTHIFRLQKVKSALTRGAFYTLETPLKGWETPNASRRKQLWLCPVTLTVLGHYPKNIYFVDLKRIPS